MNGKKVMEAVTFKLQELERAALWAQEQKK
jgi:hypothetical protein